MSSEWGRVKVEDACELIVDCVNKTAPIVDHKTPYRMIRTSHIKNGRICLTDEKFVSRETYEKWIRRAKLEVGDVLLTREAPLGSVAMIREQDTLFLGQRIVQYRANREVLDPGFLLYSFLAPDLQAQFHSYGGTGSTVDHIRVPDCVRFEISLPALAEQKAIAHILGALDDKIELNRKTNETLEAMAKALFKSWFVDFDPVRAKAEGRPTGLPAKISDLFPDSFEDSELGEIPRGWQCSPLADQSIYISRGISPAYCEEGGVLVLNQKCIRDSRVSFEKARRHDPKKKQIIGRKVRRFDALVNSTGVGTLGRVAMMPICPEEVVVDSHVTVVRGRNDKESFFISSTLLNRQTEIEALGEGSTGQTELSRAVLGSVPVIFPSSQLIFAYFDSAYTIQDKIEKNDQASVALASTRDTLLPKLISGEIRIPDAEKMLEEVGV
jgi:type I restriction enzyme S subunit